MIACINSHISHEPWSTTKYAVWIDCCGNLQQGAAKGQHQQQHFTTSVELLGPWILAFGAKI